MKVDSIQPQSMQCYSGVSKNINKHAMIDKNQVDQHKYSKILLAKDEPIHVRYILTIKIAD